jgi:uncharacterized protein (TIGR03437 family)
LLPARQVNAVVPYQVQSKSSVCLEVQYQGQTTGTLKLPVTPAAPAFFSRNASGLGVLFGYGDVTRDLRGEVLYVGNGAETLWPPNVTVAIR